MSVIIEKKLKEKNINVILENGVKEIKKENEELKILLEKGQIETDFIILCIGVRPETKLAKECNIKMNEKGSIIVNQYMQTSDENIYALGDSIQVTNFVTKKEAYIPLAGPANRQARVVANHICNKKGSYKFIPLYN